THSYTLSLHDALPIYDQDVAGFDPAAENRLLAAIFRIEYARRPGDFRILHACDLGDRAFGREITLQDRQMPLRVKRIIPTSNYRSEEHTSELQSPCNL